MLSHERVWEALDALATRYSLSPSGLAKRAGLDPTAFNRSKRYSGDGRPRWPSTESLAKVFDATGASWVEFSSLMEGQAGYTPPSQMTLDGSIVGFAEHGTTGVSIGSHVRNGRKGTWFDLPASLGEDAFAFKVQGDELLPVYRDEDIIIVAPSMPLQPGDRVVVRVTAGEMLVKTLGSESDQRVELRPLNGGPTPLLLERGSIDWIARIVWASQ